MMFVRRFRPQHEGPGQQDRQVVEQRWEAMQTRTHRMLGDIDYYVRQPLTWRDGTVMVAAGMRGAVTLAAAQTLPLQTPYRSSIILVAFAVAVLSLMIQGSILGPLVRWIKPSVPDPEDLRRQRQALSEALAGVEVERREEEGPLEHKLRTLVARRDLLLDLGDEGYYDPECTASVIASIDASELGLRLQVEQVDLLMPEERRTSGAKAREQARAQEQTRMQIETQTEADQRLVEED